MSNQILIDYENSEKQKNLDSISVLNNTISSINDAITQMNTNIASFNTQKTSIQQQISDLEAGNVLIDEIIVILGG